MDMESKFKVSDLSASHFIKCFDSLRDIRNKVKVHYPMSEVLFLVVCSVVSGYESNRAIEGFGKIKLEWLRNYFPYIHGIPHHETIGNIIGIIDKKEFELAFIEWVNLQYGLKAQGLIHIDGKRLRSSVNRKLQETRISQGGKNAELILNAYGSSDGKVIAQINVSESGDEQEGAERLIKQLDLKGKIITGDSNFCVKKILKKIIDKEGHYVMTLKKNNPTLYKLAEEAFEEFAEQQTQFETKNISHGRQELRTYSCLDKSVNPHHKFLEYSGLLKMIKVERIRNVVRTDKFSNEVHYYITSLDKDVEFLANSIRSHWSVENNLHWVLDVEFKEDASRKRTGNQASNFSLIRKIVFNLISEKKEKRSINAVRMACALSDSERQNILGIP